MNCFQCFCIKEILATHREVQLEIIGEQVTKTTEKDSNEILTGHCKQLKVPFEIYGGFESFRKLIVVILTNIILIIIKIVLVAVMDMNQFMLTIDLVRLYYNIKVQMQVTKLLTKRLKDLRIVTKLPKST